MTLTGEAALPLDARVIGVSHPVVLSVKDAHGHNRGFLRVETFWMDEAKPRKERGEFYYRVRLGRRGHCLGVFSVHVHQVVGAHGLHGKGCVSWE